MKPSRTSTILIVILMAFLVIPSAVAAPTAPTNLTLSPGVPADRVAPV